MFRRSRFFGRHRARLPVWAGLLLISLVACRAYYSRSIVPVVSQPGAYRVERVIDGDTLVLQGGQRVRLIGVDTPETMDPHRPVEPLGKEASAFTRKHVEGKLVELQFDRERVDRYGRTLAYVYVEKSTFQPGAGKWFLNEELIRAGLSPAKLGYHYSAAMKRRFRLAEEEARRTRAGLWNAKLIPDHK